MCAESVSFELFCDDEGAPQYIGKTSKRVIYMLLCVILYMKKERQKERKKERKDKTNTENNKETNNERKKDRKKETKSKDR